MYPIGEPSALYIDRKKPILPQYVEKCLKRIQLIVLDHVDLSLSPPHEYEFDMMLDHILKYTEGLSDTSASDNEFIDASVFLQQCIEIDIPLFRIYHNYLH